HFCVIIVRISCLDISGLHLILLTALLLAIFLVMANIHIPLHVCLRLQTELAALSPNRRQTGLAFVQSEIDSFLSTQSVPAPATAPVSNKHTKAKRSAGKTSSRNDGRKRKRLHVPEEEEEVVREEEEEGSQDEMVGIDAAREGESEGENQLDDPVSERVRKAKTKPWEIVDNLRGLTAKGAKFLQNLASISEQGRLDSLISLTDKLSLLLSVDIPQTTSLEVIIKRCVIMNVHVMEDHFLHMVSLMQLSLWIDHRVLQIFT